MVKEIKIRFDFFQCERSKHVFKDKKMAEKCEKYCKEHNSYNTKITKYGIPLKGN